MPCRAQQKMKEFSKLICSFVTSQKIRVILLDSGFRRNDGAKQLSGFKRHSGESRARSEAFKRYPGLKPI
jgi:hypothetical protein